MRLILKYHPVYLFLLPVFFVFHGYTENYDFIPVKDVSLLLLIYLLAPAVLFLFFWVVFRNRSKAALLSFYSLCFYFFFGYIYDVLYSLDPQGFLSKYSVIIVSFLIGFFFLAFFLFRYKGAFQKLNYVLNVFLVCLLLVDVVWLATKVFNRQKNQNNDLSETFIHCNHCSKPDIYLLVADEYAGDRQLKETMNFDNSGFKRQLESRGFFSPQSNSNYNYTVFSISSMLQMDYLKGIVGRSVDHNDLSVCYKAIRENNVFRFLSGNGYALYNFSIFDIHDQPSITASSVLPGKLRFITAQTFFNRIEKNIVLNMANGLGAAVKKKSLYMYYQSNVRALDSLKAAVHKKTATPKFVYTHLIMPHFPYYFTRSGISRPVEEIQSGTERDIPKYLEYVEYTNKVVLQLIDSIRANSAKPPVIIFLSDHGFRQYPSEVNRNYFFSNQLNVYLPGHNYEQLYNGISSVNLFRVLFNSEFNQRLPLLADSSHYISP